jgi:hypothetical protein
MQRWMVVVAAAVPALLLVLLVAAFRSGSAQATTRAPALEVGQTYGFGVGGADLVATVLAEPQGNWLQVEIRAEPKGQAVWLNLLQVSYIQPDPPADKGCDRYLPPVAVEQPAAVQHPVN